MKFDFFLASDIERDIKRIEIILGTGIFDSSNARHPLFNSAFIELMICLNDLLQKVKDLGVPVEFADDIELVGKVKNVTDTVSMIRNALCHIPSKIHIFDDVNFIRATFNVNWGNTGITIDGVFVGGDYSDDISFHFGRHKIYLFRHICRALEEAKLNLAVLIVFFSFPEFSGLQIPELAALPLQLASYFRRKK